MPKVRLKPLIEEIEGTLDDVVFKKSPKGKLIVTKRPDMTGVEWSVVPPRRQSLTMRLSLRRSLKPIHGSLCPQPHPRTDGLHVPSCTRWFTCADIDNNHVIDQFDALTIGMSCKSAVPSAADLNNDGIINVLDLELLADNYRKTGPIAWE